MLEKMKCKFNDNSYPCANYRQQNDQRAGAGALSMYISFLETT